MDMVPVTRMLRNFNVNCDNLDFDEVLRRFERRFGSSTFRNIHHSDLSPANDSIASNELHSERDSGSEDGNVSDHMSSHGVDAENDVDSSTVALSSLDFDHELNHFLASFCSLPRIRNETPIGIHHIDHDENRVYVIKSNVQVSRQVLRRELHQITMQLAEMDKLLSGEESSGNRAIVAGLKRQVRERNEQLERISKTSKRRDVEMRNVRDRLSQIVLERDKAIVDRISVLEEKQQLLDRIQTMTRAIEKCETKGEKIFHEKQRLDRCVGVLRKELLSTHHERNAIQLEYNLLQERMKQVERRNEEIRKSESIIVPKVRELHSIQQEMLELMSQIGSGNVRARGALNMLNKKRNNVLTRIATIVTKRTTVDTDTNTSHHNPHSTTPAAIAAADDDISSPIIDSSRGNDTVIESAATAAAANDHQPIPEAQDRPRANNARTRLNPTRLPSPATLQRKMTNILKGNGWNNRTSNLDSSATGGDREYERADGNSTGDGSSPAIDGSMRNKYSALRYAGVRAHEQAISDLAALRELVELREKELHRVEDELEMTRDKSDMLERELYYERQNRRRENRNLHGAQLTEAFDMVESSREVNTGHNTLFDWQNNPAPGDGEKITPIPKPVDDDETCCMSPVSEDSKAQRKIGLTNM